VGVPKKANRGGFEKRSSIHLRRKNVDLLVSEGSTRLEKGKKGKRGYRNSAVKNGKPT